MSETKFLLVRQNKCVKVRREFHDDWELPQRALCFYSASQTLAEDQLTWVKQTTERVLAILRETPPDGELFTDTVTVGRALACNYKNLDLPI